LVTTDGIDAPPALDPLAAADGTDGVEHGQHLREAHSSRTVHLVTVTDVG
jgi:hypothetical protein